jgi:hypothetical protein
MNVTAKEDDTMTYLELAPVIDTVYAIALAVILFLVVRNGAASKSEK